MTDTIEVPRELLERLKAYTACWAAEFDYRHGMNGWHSTHKEDFEAVTALLARPAGVRDAVRKDAERYRWLIASGVNVASLGGDSVRLTDQLVDAAMAAKEGV